MVEHQYLFLLADLKNCAQILCKMRDLCNKQMRNLLAQIAVTIDYILVCHYQLNELVIQR